MDDFQRKEEIISIFEEKKFLTDTLAKISPDIFLHILLFQNILYFFLILSEKNAYFSGGGPPPP